MANAEKIASTGRSDIVDCDLVAPTRLSAMRALWRTWQREGLPDTRLSRGAFDAFILEGGDALAGHALRGRVGRMTAKGFGGGLIDWPEEYRRRESIPVRQSADDHQDEIDSHIWLQ